MKTFSHSANPGGMNRSHPKKGNGKMTTRGCCWRQRQWLRASRMTLRFLARMLRQSCGLVPHWVEIFSRTKSFKRYWTSQMTLFNLIHRLIRMMRILQTFRMFIPFYILNLRPVIKSDHFLVNRYIRIMHVFLIVHMLICMEDIGFCLLFQRSWQKKARHLSSSFRNILTTRNSFLSFPSCSLFIVFIFILSGKL